MRKPDWAYDGVEETKPSWARIYDYLLGGGHNFKTDRRIAAQLTRVLPNSHHIARHNRAFLRRAVMYMAEQGIRQYLDIGSGIPTVGNVHEIARSACPDARVVYVDRDPIAVNHTELLLGRNNATTVIRDNLHNAEAILSHPEVRRLLDLRQPLALLMVCVLHFVPPTEDVAAIVARYRDRLTPGSFLALSHFTADVHPAGMAAMVEIMNNSADPIHPRTREEVTPLFTGFDLVEPGVVATSDWRPTGPGDTTDGPGCHQVYAGVARKP